MIFNSFLPIGFLLLAGNGILELFGQFDLGPDHFQSDPCKGGCKQTFQDLIGRYQQSPFGYRIAVCAVIDQYASCITDECNYKVESYPDVQHIVDLCSDYDDVNRCLDECAFDLKDAIEQLYSTIESPTFSQALDAICPPYKRYLLCTTGCSDGDLELQNELENYLSNPKEYWKKEVAYFKACLDVGFEEDNAIA